MTNPKTIMQQGTAAPGQLQGTVASQAPHGPTARHQQTRLLTGAVAVFQERATNTEAPQMASTSGSCSQWGIFDTYLEDQDRQRAQASSPTLQVTVNLFRGQTHYFTQWGMSIL